MSKKVLHIISSPKGGASITRKLGSAVVERILEKYPDAIVKERDLAADVFPHLD